MTQLLVHLGQVVHVDDQHRVGPSKALGLAVLLLQYVLEGAQVHEAGKRVGRCEIADALRGAADLLNEPGENDADRGAGREGAQHLHAEFRTADIRRPASSVPD